MLKKNIMKINILLLSFLLSFHCHADIAEMTEKSRPELNQQLRYTDRRVESLEQSGLERWETATDDGVIVGNGSTFDTKVLTNCATTSDALIYSTSTNSFGCNANISHVKVFVADGTFTLPVGFTRAYLTMCGAGGGGGGPDGGGNDAGGGGGGEGIIMMPLNLSAGNYAVTVGEAGAGGASNNNGTAGESSVFNSITVSGGSGGNKSITGGAGAAANSLTGAAGSGTTGGDGGAFYSIAGGTGGAGTDSTGGQVAGGGGGGSIFGAGGTGGSGSSSTGTTAGGYCAGGGGGANSGDGASGGSGIVILMY